MLVKTVGNIIGLLPKRWSAAPSESINLSICFEQLIFYFLSSWKAEVASGSLCVECALKDKSEKGKSVRLLQCQRFREPICAEASLRFNLCCKPKLQVPHLSASHVHTCRLWRTQVPSVLQNGGCLQSFKRIKSVAVACVLVFNSFSASWGVQ